MWIFSQDGFYSIVQKGEQFHVRARRKQDLVNVGLTPTKSFAGSDYPWRAILANRGELLMLMEKLGKSVDYPNFKARISVMPPAKKSGCWLKWPIPTFSRRLRSVIPRRSEWTKSLKV